MSITNRNTLPVFNGGEVQTTSSLTVSAAEITTEQTTSVEATTQPVTSSDNVVTTTTGMDCFH